MRKLRKKKSRRKNTQRTLLKSTLTEAAGMGGGWMQWLLIAVVLVAIASYFLK